MSKCIENACGAMPYPNPKNPKTHNWTKMYESYERCKASNKLSKEDSLEMTRVYKPTKHRIK